VVHALSEAQTIQLHALYQQEWWSAGRTLDEVREMLAHTSVVLGVVQADTQELLAFARVLTDGVFKAFLFDVIVQSAHRGTGIGTFLMAKLAEHPVLARVKHIELYCLPERKAFYQRHGFSAELGELVLMRKTRGE
jgi:predicted GNAT family N-acyltransferase